MSSIFGARKWPAVVLLGLLLVSTCFTQTYRGRVQGLVTDPTDAVIPGANVTLLNVETGVSAVRQTSETGVYLFDLVNPGNYSVTIESAGFSTFIQENVVVQMRGDVTVNATLQTGAVQESITVTETPAAVQFNTTSNDFTLNSKIAEEIPRIDRNPFKLTLIAPSAVNTRGEMQPYHSWAANSVDLGGGTNLKNDLQVDGSPVGLGHKNSYPPNMDAVQEVVVSQNSVDAESGHSAGGLISMTLKSGTNDFHGTGFYLGRYPWMNAEADRTRHSSNSTRQHEYGGTLGNPIIKNKLFNFFSYERWNVSAPRTYQITVPTPLERAGDFSKTYNIDGGIKTVYDPFTTTLDPGTGAVSRTPFAGNVVPSARFDPLSASLTSSFWDPNNPGDNITGVNNFRLGYTESYTYYNFSDRVDYNISEKWRVYGRVSRYNTTNINPNPTPNNSQLYVPTGTSRGADQIAGDAVYVMNPSTVLNFHGDWHKVIDAYVSDSLGDEGWGAIWPGNPWYQDYQDNSPGVPVYFPLMNIGGVGFGGRGFYWDQKPQGQAYNAKISHQHGSHYIKAGLEHRRGYGVTFVGNTSQFFFPTELTAETFNGPDTKHNGFGYASFLLGALDGSSQMIGGPAPDPHDEYWGMFIQDDWKVTPWLTINMGLRNEYESAWHDPGHNMSRGLDLNSPVPQMDANPPNMPQEALNLVGGSNYYSWNGLWQWTDNNKPGMWDAPHFALAPRVGAAFRIDEKTVLRVGYARYVIPTELMLSQAPVSGFETVSFLEPPFFGVKGYQNTQGLIEGVPQQTINDPYPAATNPLIPINGKAAGTNVGRGGTALLWYPRNFKKAHNDRVNINFQRQMPGNLVVSATWFLNFGNQHYSRALNEIDPRILESEQNAVNASVSNPFYNYLDSELFPGPLRNQETVTLSTLLRKYPQYGALYETGTTGAAERYQSLELQARKNFSSGWTFMTSYVYIREKTQQPFNELDTYLDNLTYQNSAQPRHRFTAAGVYELPFGQGKTYLGSASRAVDAIVGGWKVSGVLTHTSGAILRFGKMSYDGGRVTVDNPTQGRWFNTEAFTQIPANTYAIRSNPLQFDDLTGPSFTVLDAALTKSFKITERIDTQLEMRAFNALNQLNLGNPNMSVTSSQFGQALYQGTPRPTLDRRRRSSAATSVVVARWSLV
jgi:hypothetical protein